ncbi:MAG: hypothetical protein J6X33_09555 [Clostridiales bacterium]|nr:hypothetical protein [Clostridiales bacterium]
MKKKYCIVIFLFFLLMLVVCVCLCINIGVGNSSGTVPYTVPTYEVKTVFNGVIDLIQTDMYIGSSKREKLNMINDYLESICDHQDNSDDYVTKVVPGTIEVNGDYISYGEGSIYVVFKVDDSQTEYFWYHNKDEYDSNQKPFNYSIVK